MIEEQAKLIAALASTMRESTWASEILTRCAQIDAAVKIIRTEAHKREGGER